MVVGSGVEPERDPLLTIAFALGEHVGLQNVRLPGDVAEKFEVHFVVLVAGLAAFGGQLHAHPNPHH